MTIAASIRPIISHTRVLTASVIGTAVEYYDFYIFASVAAMFFGPLFFPAEASETQTLFALASSGIAFIARPLGAVAFGHIGDRIGRKATLIVSLLLMGFCTVAVAFLPTYAMAGLTAPILLCLLRFIQGFAVGGEWAGAALLSIEHAPEGWRARFGATAALGVNIGKGLGYAFLLLLGLALTEPEMLAWGWRVPFLASALIVLFGLWVRLRIGEGPEYLAVLEHGHSSRAPIVQLFSEYRATLLAASVVVSCGMAMGTIEIFALAQASGPLGYDRNALLIVQLIIWPMVVLTLLLAATCADLTSPDRTIRLACAAVVPVGLVFGIGLGSGSLLAAGAAICLAKCVGVTIQACGAQWLSSRFPIGLRCTGISLVMSIAAIVGQALVPVAAQFLSTFGMACVGPMFAALGLAAFTALRFARPAADEPARLANADTMMPALGGTYG